MQARKAFQVQATGAVLAAAGAADVASFSSMSVFGDSLSDTGNVFIVTGCTQPTPLSRHVRYADGPRWIDLMAAQFGFPLANTPSFAGDKDYAWAAPARAPTPRPCRASSRRCRASAPASGAARWPIPTACTCSWPAATTCATPAATTRPTAPPIGRAA